MRLRSFGPVFGILIPLDHGECKSSLIESYQGHRRDHFSLFHISRGKCPTPCMFDLTDPNNKIILTVSIHFQPIEIFDYFWIRKQCRSTLINDYLQSFISIGKKRTGSNRAFLGCQIQDILFHKLKHLIGRLLPHGFSVFVEESDHFFHGCIHLTIVVNVWLARIFILVVFPTKIKEKFHPRWDFVHCKQCEIVIRREGTSPGGSHFIISRR
mmetsp:Transcript_23008/g.49796  ORF Transcript_23008/g.49796 Transcript_23008/m.49796 type:complete len:212 (+) Transcript_23008:902-1537(+)